MVRTRVRVLEIKSQHAHSVFSEEPLASLRRVDFLWRAVESKAANRPPKPDGDSNPRSPNQHAPHHPVPEARLGTHSSQLRAERGSPKWRLRYRSMTHNFRI